jgi:hypothetical protein
VVRGAGWKVPSDPVWLATRPGAVACIGRLDSDAQPDPPCAPHVESCFRNQRPAACPPVALLTLLPLCSCLPVLRLSNIAHKPICLLVSGGSQCGAGESCMPGDYTENISRRLAYQIRHRRHDMSKGLFLSIPSSARKGSSGLESRGCTLVPLCATRTYSTRPLFRPAFAKKRRHHGACPAITKTIRPMGVLDPKRGHRLEGMYGARRV